MPEITTKQNEPTVSSIKEAIILAGGLGTRLRSAVADVPKCIAPVAGRPFLFYVINYWRSQGIEKFIFSLGYKHEVIEEYLQQQFSTLSYQTTIEQEPLGTGGAIQLACRQATEENVLVANGDTLFKINLAQLFSFHQVHNSACTLALKPMQNFDRYGVVELNENGIVKAFKEKMYYSSGLINGGAYILNVQPFLKESFADKFSFEKDYLEKKLTSHKISGLIQQGYFIDIGIPEDFQQAQLDLQTPVLDLHQVDKSWTLFLDRDGVINYEKKLDYILNWKEFTFYERVTEAIRIFSKVFGRIIIVSNQRGVGKQLMTEDDLAEIHQQMKNEIMAAGGEIAKIYYCTSTDNAHASRKPNPGMAFQAQREHPEINFSKSIMVGNKHSDMLFGRNAGMYAVYLTTTNPEQEFPHPDIDMIFSSLIDFAKAF